MSVRGRAHAKKSLPTTPEEMELASNPDIRELVTLID